jgi:hypothetical protein
MNAPGPRHPRRFSDAGPEYGDQRAVTPEQAAKLAPRPASPGEFDRERDRALEAAGSLHRQGAHDQRAAELARMRAKL